MKKTLINIFVVLGLLTSPFLGAFGGGTGVAASSSQGQVNQSLDAAASALKVPLAQRDYMPGEVIITFVEDVTFDRDSVSISGLINFGVEAVDQFNLQKGLKSFRPLISPKNSASASLNSSEFPFKRSYVLQFPETTSIPALIRELRELDGVELVEPNYVYHIAQDFWSGFSGPDPQ